MRSPLYQKAMDADDEGQIDLALRLMEECAREGDPIACFTVALWYLDEERCKVNIELSAKWLACLEALAEKGNAEAQWELGQNYRFGNLFPLDIERANYWLERAAEGGYAEAQHHLAWYFETGQYNFSLDLTAAAMWYQRAFEQDHPETLYLFALRKFNCGRPTGEAIELLKKAADKGFIQAVEVLHSCMQ